MCPVGPRDIDPAVSRNGFVPVAEVSELANRQSGTARCLDAGHEMRPVRGQCVYARQRVGAARLSEFREASATAAATSGR